MSYKIFCVVIFYNPDIIVAHECITSIRSQVTYISVIDNSTRLPIQLLENDSYDVIRLGSNFGVGYAQNIGIQIAIEAGADYIILSDQDTIFPPNYVIDMFEAFEKMKFNDRVAAVCPNFFDVNRSELCPMIIDAGSLGFKLKTATSGLHKVCFANASGMIIPAQVFSDVGLMREDLFIDCVDTEWCTRAEHLGYSIYCNADMVITHSLGDRSINVLGRVITQHSPLRHYYLARNSMYLALYSKHLTVNKRLFFLLRAIKRVVGHAVLSAPRLENLRMGVLGIWHGVIGRLGKYD